jgi:geranylgeranyl pyrophosphate synthase
MENIEYHNEMAEIISEIMMGIGEDNLSAKRLKELFNQAKNLMKAYGPDKDKKEALQKLQELIDRVDIFKQN